MTDDEYLAKFRANHLEEVRHFEAAERRRVLDELSESDSYLAGQVERRLEDQDAEKGDT